MTSVAAALGAAEKTAVPEAAAACAHCGAPLAAGGRFCCGGCAAAYELVGRLGLAEFYRRRTVTFDEPVAVPEMAVSDFAAYARAEPDGTWSLDAAIDGLRCAACLWLIETALARQEDVVEARLAFSSGRLRLRWRGPPERGNALLDLVQRLGYRVAPYTAERVQAAATDEERRLLHALAVAGFAAANIMLLSVAVWSGGPGDMGTATRDLLHWVSALIALPAIAYAGRPFFASACSALRVGRTNMDVPISVGVILTAAMSVATTIQSGAHTYFDSAVTLLFFLLVGRYLELRARGRARSLAAGLLALTGAPVTRVTADGSTVRLMPGALAPGDTVLVAAGERIGADGEVISGVSEIDHSLLDGETLPSPARPGGIVRAGMINLAAPLTLRVTAIGEGTFLAELVRLIEAAERGRFRFSALSDRMSRAYAPVVHLLSLATLALWLSLGHGWEAALSAAIAVLIITCPCALGLAVPAVQVIAAGRLMRRGILLKSGTALERLAAIDTVVFDKTGTLTDGRPTLTTAADCDPEALAVASSLAAASRHPLSRAIRASCPSAAPATDAIEHPGAGLSAGDVRLGSREFCGGSADRAPLLGPELFLSRPGRAPVRFGFADPLRDGAVEAVSSLRATGKRVLLLSGDREAVVEAVAGQVGIAEWRGQMKPADKVAAIVALASERCHVLMVGDGLNDAPALSAASVSMSPSSGADLSQNTADIVFQGRSLAAVTEALDVARRSQRLVRQNVFFAVLYNAAAVPLAMAGLVTPLIAAVAMSSSSLVVILNALRLHSGVRGAAG